MNVNDFIEEYNRATDKGKIIKKHIIKNYVDYVDKINEANKIVELSSYTKRDDGTQRFCVNSPIRYMLFVMAIVRCYTDLEFDATNGVLEFDILEKNGATDLIIESIGPDYERFETVLNMVLEDFLDNERDLVSFIENRLESISNALDVLEEKEDGDRVE